MFTNKQQCVWDNVNVNVRVASRMRQSGGWVATSGSNDAPTKSNLSCLNGATLNMPSGELRKDDSRNYGYLFQKIKNLLP